MMRRSLNRNGLLLCGALLAIGPLAAQSGGTGLVPAPVKSAVRSNLLQRSPGVEITALPKVFDLRALNRLTPIRNQGPIGTCWAFASVASLESSLVQSLGNAQGDYVSEKNLKNNAGYPQPNDGGTAEKTLGYLARWSGPVPEELDPYSKNPEATASPTIPTAKILYKLASVDFLPARDSGAIKRYLMQFGALYSSLNVGETDAAAAKIFSEKNSAFFNPIDAESNHAVTIVGWDDGYSRTKFLTVGGKKPERDGAWIVRNSWGTDWGDKGYFYVSYEDRAFAADAAGFQADVGNRYNRIYQHDYYSADASWPADGQSSGYAVRFQAEDNEDLQAVGLFTKEAQVHYRVSVGASLADAIKAPVSAEGTIEYSGYHVVNLEKAFALAKGKNFFILVRQQVESGTSSVPLFYDFPEAARHLTKQPRTFYYDLDGADSLQELDQNSELVSIPIKAFSTDRGQKDVKVSVLEFTEPEVFLNVGESHQFQVVVRPENATARAVKFFVDKASAPLVKIAADGTMTALKAGSFDLKASTTDQSVLATARVTILAADKTAVRVTDEALESSIRTALGKTTGALTTKDLDTVKSLTVLGAVRSLASLSLLKNLESLDLSKVRVADFQPLAQVTSLTSLALRETTLSDLAFLTKLKNLKQLDLQSANIAQFDALSTLSGLESLSLAGTSIRDVQPLTGLKNLQRLDLRQTQVAEAKALAVLTKLKALFLAGCSITDLTSLKPLSPQLAEKDFSTEPLAKGKVFADERLEAAVRSALKLGKAKALTSTALSSLDALDLSDLKGSAPLDLTGLEQLKNLTALTIRDKVLVSAAPVSQLSQLVELTLSGCGLKDASFAAALTNLNYLDLSKNALRSVRPLVGLVDLMEAYLSNNQITDATLLENLESLGVLDLENNALQSVRFSKPVKSLRKLNVAGNKISSFVGLEMQPKLSDLQLRGNPTKDWGNLSQLLGRLAVFDFTAKGTTFDPNTYDFGDDFELDESVDDADYIDDEDESSWAVNDEVWASDDDPYFDSTDSADFFDDEDSLDGGEYSNGETSDDDVAVSDEEEE